MVRVHSDLDDAGMTPANRLTIRNEGTKPFEREMVKMLTHRMGGGNKNIYFFVWRKIGPGAGLPQIHWQQPENGQIPGICRHDDNDFSLNWRYSSIARICINKVESRGASSSVSALAGPIFRSGTKVSTATNQLARRNQLPCNSSIFGIHGHPIPIDRNVRIISGRRKQARPASEG
jgi:hypothetical protein